MSAPILGIAFLLRMIDSFKQYDLFFALTGFALIVLRRKRPGAERSVRVPLYPVVPLLFDRDDDPGQFRNLVEAPEMAAVALREAQAQLTWRMDHAERRLTGCKLTSAGVVGGFQNF